MAISSVDISKSLQGIDFPANKQDLVQKAQSNNADQDVLNELQNLPEQEYQSMADVESGFGQEHRQQP